MREEWTRLIITTTFVLSTVANPRVVQAAELTPTDMHTQNQPHSSVGDVLTREPHTGEGSSYGSNFDQGAGPECEGSTQRIGTVHKLLNRIMGQALSDNARLCDMPPESDRADTHHKQGTH